MFRSQFLAVVWLIIGIIVAATHEYFERLGKIRLEIDGSDLAELGLGESPRVGEILAELRRRKLNGVLDGRESELAAARELIGQ